ncbi:hypothetical protein DAVIS_02039 [Mycobacterium marinum]|uniref:Uncharacterized protein n=1 Tax=Mycobacterium marinum TaxID=1781 RepID=A0A3E2MXQ8_MYCMR|nr:hypothetical protein DAVIS_02039 [Mycobacterium marinum]
MSTQTAAVPIAAIALAGYIVGAYNVLRAAVQTQRHSPAVPKTFVIETALCRYRCVLCSFSGLTCS